MFLQIKLRQKQSRLCAPTYVSVCVCLCGVYVRVRARGGCARARMCVRVRACAFTCGFAVSHGRAADVVSDSLVKFQQSMKRDMKVAPVRVCARVCNLYEGTV